MEETLGAGVQVPSPPLRLFDRLAQLHGYTWDQSIEPFHSVSICLSIILHQTMLTM